MKNFTFGMKNMRITQSYNGTTSHKPHWYNSKNYADYPIDIAGIDGNKEPYYAPVDMKVVAIIGIGTSVTNTIWLVSAEKCNTPSGVFKPFIMLTHWNDSDPYIKNLKVGSIVKAGQPICEEGVDGATANHLHMVCGNALRGCGNGFIQNSNGKWVSKGYCLKPEEVMFIDKEFTNILSTNDLTFKEKPKEEIRDNSFLGSKGYLTLGDSGDNVSKITSFMRKTFPAYTSTKALGSYYGKYIKASITEFQKRTGLLADGNVGPITLSKLKEYGFEE